MAPVSIHHAMSPRLVTTIHKPFVEVVSASRLVVVSQMLAISILRPSVMERSVITLVVQARDVAIGRWYGMPQLSSVSWPSKLAEKVPPGMD